MRRKNRIVVEYTSPRPISAHKARTQVDELLELGRQRSLDRARWWRFGAVKIVTKEFDRVVQALKRRDKW